MRIIPTKPIPCKLTDNMVIIHRDPGARFHVQCDRFAVWVDGEDDGEALFEAWASQLRAHRVEIEALRPWVAAGWVDGLIFRASPYALPIVDGVVSQWVNRFEADNEDDAVWPGNTARMGRETYERCVALPTVQTTVTFEEALRLGRGASNEST